jgi:RNA polymerase sigma-70 factor, ECF subfamily
MVGDAELMARYCDGDREAFRALYDRVAPRLFGYLRRMSGDRALAEDLLQQTMLKIHRARHAYVRGADPLPWAYAIARRVFLDEMRRRARVRKREASTATPGAEPIATISGRAVEAAGADDHAPSAGLVAAALSALQALPPAQREAVVLTKLQGKSVAEAAALAGTTPGALKVRVHRGYAALRRALQRPEEDA